MSDQITKEAAKKLLDEVREKKARGERVRKAKNRGVMSAYIRVAESDLYDFAPVTRAVLMTIAFLQVNDEDTKVPEESKFRGQYTGWCYASQKRLACRGATTEPVVFKIIEKFEKDGVIESRTWWDSMGYPHKEYHVIEEVVDAHQRPDGYMAEDRSKQPRKGGNKTANTGSFKPGNKAAAKSESQPTSQPFPPESTAVSEPTSQPFSKESAGVLETAANSGQNGCQGGEGGYSLAELSTRRTPWLTARSVPAT